ncbi:MAG: HEPN domain-containing protein [Deltaproteobacteria bacterium]|nr:HEPN domain-containing protein [Deltaproteobacteria bacterium]
MNDVNKQVNVKLEVEKGDAALRQAHLLFQNKEFDGCISRAYYAVFHYVSALLLTQGIEARSHEGLVRLFNLHFIRTAIFPKRYSTILSHAQKAREESDYRPEIPFTEEDAKNRLTEAEEFITSVGNTLRQEQYLST